MADYSKLTNKVVVVGNLMEKNLFVEEKEVTIRGGGKEKKITCKVINRKEFKNPSLSVRVTNEDGSYNDVSVYTYPIAQYKLDDKGNKVDNPRFKDMLAVVEDFNAKVDGGDGDKIRVLGSINASEYASAKDGKNYEFHSYPQVTAYAIYKSTDSEDISEGEISGIIKSITPEIKVGSDDSEDETGRLKVELYTFGYTGKTYPVTFFVGEDLADDFEDLYSAGDSATVVFEITKRHVGGATKKKAAFGRSSNIASGFDVEEYVIVGGDEPVDEDNAKYISKKEFKEALAERQNYIDQTISDAKDNAKNKSDGSTDSKSKGLGRKSNIDVDDDGLDSDTDLPF